jgi:branched-chain amino acid transport system substrate-binding protein
MRIIEKSKVLIVVVLVALLFLFGMPSACSDKPDKTIKIGAIYPLSGPLATAGESAMNGILLAVDIINGEHDLSLPLARSKGIPSLAKDKIEVLFEDSLGTPESGVVAARKLIDEENVTALIGCYQSSVTGEVSQIAESGEVPFLTAASTAPELTRMGLEWFFRTTPDEDIFVRNFFQLLEDIKESKGEPGSLGIIYEDSVYGTGFADIAKQNAADLGYDVVAEIPYPADTIDVTAEAQELIDTRPEVLLQASYTRDAILFLQAYRNMDFYPKAILADDAGFSDPDFIKTTGRDSDYILVRSTWSADIAAAMPLVGKVNDLFREKFGTDMDDTGARALTAMLVLAEAIDRAGSTAPEDIRAALLETDIPGNALIMPWDGVRFDNETHQNTKAKGIITQIIEGQYFTIWPWDLATREIIWPMPRE